MTNKDNIQSPEKFNPPTRFEVGPPEEHNKPCFVYDTRAWANKNNPNRYRGSQQES